MLTQHSKKRLFAQRSLLIFTLLAISACSTAILRSDQDWPRDLPPLDYYIDYYNQDPANQQAISLNEYLLWVRHLYLGWELYSNGWLALSGELANTIEDKRQREIAKQKLIVMGRIVSPEWAKHKKFSTIKTRHLIIWGNALNESPAHNEQLKIIDQVLADANLLIKGQLSAKDIRAERYYPQEPFDEVDYPL